MKTYMSKLSRTIGLLSVTSLLAVGGWLSAADVTQPSDTIVGSSGNVSGDGGVANAISIDKNPANTFATLTFLNKDGTRTTRTFDCGCCNAHARAEGRPTLLKATPAKSSANWRSAYRYVLAVAGAARR